MDLHEFREIYGSHSSMTKNSGTGLDALDLMKEHWSLKPKHSSNLDRLNSQIPIGKYLEPNTDSAHPDSSKRDTEHKPASRPEDINQTHKHPADKFDFSLITRNETVKSFSNGVYTGAGYPLEAIHDLKRLMSKPESFIDDTLKQPADGSIANIGGQTAGMMLTIAATGAAMGWLRIPRGMTSAAVGWTLSALTSPEYTKHIMMSAHARSKQQH